MEAFSSRRVLVVGPEKGLLAQVAQELEAANLAITFVAAEQIDWQDTDGLNGRFIREKPSFLLHESDSATEIFRRSGADDERREAVRRAKLLGSACAQHACVPMHLSDYHVFGGDTKSIYDESDPPAPQDSYGRFVLELEDAFITAMERHMILRFSWLIDPRGDNLFTRILAALHAGEHLALSAYRRGTPTWKMDARRVICGIARQVVSGAQNWGCFHYGSTDSCTEFEFGIEVHETLMELGSFTGTITADENKDGADYPVEPASAALKSRRIRNNFGVHSRSWRQGLKAQINHWLDQHQHAGQPSDRSSSV